MQKSKITHEHFHITPAMTLIKGIKSNSLELEIDDKLTDEDNLKSNKERILEFLFKNGVHLQSHSDNINNMNKSITTIKVPPTPLVVEFNSNTVTISILNKEE